LSRACCWSSFLGERYERGAPSASSAVAGGFPGRGNRLDNGRCLAVVGDGLPNQILVLVASSGEVVDVDTVEVAVLEEVLGGRELWRDVSLAVVGGLPPRERGGVLLASTAVGVGKVLAAERVSRVVEEAAVERDEPEGVECTLGVGVPDGAAVVHEHGGTAFTFTPRRI
jgi:hypothetical protein